MFLKNISYLNCIPFIRSVFIVCFLILIIPNSVYTQNKSKLQSKKKRIQKEIQITNRLLRTNKKNKSNSIEQLNKLNANLEYRGKLIHVISNEITIISSQSEQYYKQINSLKKELTELKKEYAKIIYHSANNINSYNLTLFLLSAESFNQAFSRFNYLKQYLRYRKQQKEAIELKSKELKKNLAQLKGIKQEKFSLVATKEKEKNELKKSKDKTIRVINNLKKQEKKLRRELYKKRKEKRNLDKTIARIIKKEIAAAQRRKKLKKTTKKNKLDNSQKNQPIITDSRETIAFASKKGKLSWPVKNGIITGKFGKQKHPVLKYVYIENNGIDISITKQTEAAAIYDGEISTIVFIPGQGKVVIIRHGSYLSVYSYFSNVMVKKGQKIKNHQKIGTLISKNPEEKKYIVHLEIWKGLKKLNPQQWITQYNQ